MGDPWSAASSENRRSSPSDLACIAWEDVARPFAAEATVLPSPINKLGAKYMQQSSGDRGARTIHNLNALSINSNVYCICCFTNGCDYWFRSAPLAWVLFSQCDASVEDILELSHYPDLKPALCADTLSLT